jgi:hypothetical protein
MPGAQCTRSLVRAGGSEVCARVFTAEAPETSGIPHAMVLRFIRDLPGDEFLLPPSLTNSRRVRARLGRHASVNLTPTTGARTTRLHRPRQCRSSCAPLSIAHEVRSPCDLRRTRHRRVHRIPRSTFVTTAIRPSPMRRDAEETSISEKQKQNIFREPSGQ